MGQYFDKNFVKFLLGFMAFVVLSFLIIVIAQMYQSQKMSPDAPKKLLAK